MAKFMRVPERLLIPLDGLDPVEAAPLTDAGLRKGLIEPARTQGRSRRYSERDLALLRRIQELTNDGVSLAGVKKILELEAELDDAQAEIGRLRSELDRAFAEAREAVNRVHREYRRDLVPVTKAVVRIRN